MAGTPLVLPGGKDNRRGEKAANSGGSAETSAKSRRQRIMFRRRGTLT